MQTRRKFLRYAGLASLSLSAGMAGYIYHEDSSLSVSSYHIKLGTASNQESQKLKLVHLSDIHNAPHQFPGLMQDILKHIEAFQAQFCLITGDLLDKRDPKPEPFFQFAQQLNSLLPCLYVSGNHEHYPQEGSSSLFQQYKKDFDALGLICAEQELFGVDDTGQLRKDTRSKLAMCGISDPHAFGIGGLNSWKQQLELLSVRASKLSKYRILLTHRPEHAPLYAELGFDLSLAGHAHGGQIRFPGIGALVAPHQGLFPKYSEGLHSFHNESRHIIISRGIGTSVIPVRTLNKPELVQIELEF